MNKTKDNNHDSTGWIDAGYLLGENIGLIFTDRNGACSTPPYNSLNLAYRNGDDPRDVDANRNIVAGEIDVSREGFIYLQQVHGIEVKKVEQNDLRDLDSMAWDTFSETDGIFTTENSMVLSVLTADCLPMAMAEKEGGVVAMLHSGWRGTIEDIVNHALSRIGLELGMDAHLFRAVAGPAIGPCCYKVDEGRARLFVEKYGIDSGVVLENDGYRLDLFQANRLNLLKAGLKEENINKVGGCTCCDCNYFSFRREGVTGRQGSFVYLKN